MNKKLPVGKACLLIDRSLSMLQLCGQLNAMSQPLGMRFIEPQAGAGYLQWSLPGEGWIAFSDVDDTFKFAAAKLFKSQCDKMRQLLEGSAMKDAVLTVPSESEFVYFRQNGNDMEVALTAWGYKYVDIPTGDPIETWIKQTETQEVNVGFTWDKKLLTNFPFQLNHLLRETSDDGFFHVGTIPVSSAFNLETKNGLGFQLVVEKGKLEYIYDITRSAKVEVSVTQDGSAVVGQQCVVSFNGTDYQIQTNESGLATFEMPLAAHQDGTSKEPQPECRAECNQEVQSQTPSVIGEVLRFNFAFVTESPAPSPQVDEPIKPKEEPKMLKIRMFDRDGKPLKDFPVKLQRANAEVLEGRTDADGNLLFPASLFTIGETVKVVCSYKGRVKLKMLKPDK